MNLPGRPGSRPRFLAHLGAVLCAALLFAASFPNPLVPGGIPWCAWIALVPVFWLVRQVGFGAALLWGGLYGCAAYTLFNFWLVKFHPLAGFLAGGLFFGYFALLFPLFKLAVLLFPRRGYILQWLVWLGWEYLRTLGFAGYSYGILGYSQWQVLPLIQIAGIFGVWGVSALLVFPSAWLAAALEARFGRGAGYGPEGRGGRRPASFLRGEWLPGALWLLALIASLGYGFLAPRDFSAAPTLRVALIQHKTDPWKGGINQYHRNFEVLRRLSLEALEAEPRTDMVVWSETAFIPRIDWQVRFRDDPAAWALVQKLLAFLESAEVPFLIGNDDARKEPPKNPEENFRVDYNGALLFDRGVLVGRYWKLHLVPFTEYFPYRRQLPGIYDALRRADTHFWERGSEAVVFNLPLAGEGETSRTVRFSTPICFEDTFGYLSREFVRRGAELIVNISNDAWSGSLSAQMQHLGMTVFRAVENRRALVRATASGQTCAIAPDGRVIAMAPAFEEAWLAAEVPLLTELTGYARFGDIWGRAFACLAIVILLTGAVPGILRRFSKRNVL